MYNPIMCEALEIKPSLEEIPDEYLHSLETMAVHIFASRNEDDQAKVRLFKNTLSRHGYSIDANHEHCLETDNIHNILETICSAEKDPGGMILFFSGWSRRAGTILAFDGNQSVNINVQEIITKFTSYTCLQLKNKPKICIFHVRSPPPRIQTDSAIHFGHAYALTYDSPAEADMLIIYKITENGVASNFTEQLCQKIDTYGKAEDIFSMMALMEFSNDESRPLLVSTLTRKFYFVPNDHRGHHLNINQMHDEVMALLDYISDKISKASRLAASSSRSRNSGRVQNGERRRLGSNRSNGSVSTDQAPKPRWKY